MKIKKQNLWVCLDSTVSPFRYFQLSENEKVEERLKDKENVYFQVSNLAEAREVCQRYIAHFNLGSSNWTGGRVINDNSEFVANISYNGRIWDSEEFKNTREIKI